MRAIGPSSCRSLFVFAVVLLACGQVFAGVTASIPTPQLKVPILDGKAMNEAAAKQVPAKAACRETPATDAIVAVSVPTPSAVRSSIAEFKN